MRERGREESSHLSGSSWASTFYGGCVMHSPQVRGELCMHLPPGLGGLSLSALVKKEGNGKHRALAGLAWSWLAASPSLAVSIVSWL